MLPLLVSISLVGLASVAGFETTMSSCSFDLKACWSKAGVGTCMVLEYNKSESKRKPRLVLDLGATPVFDKAMQADVALISHGHVDHIGAIFSHARAHAVSKGGCTPTYYVPDPIVSRLIQARDAVSALDAANDGSGPRTSSMIKMNIVGVSAGDEIKLPIKKLPNGVQLFARVFEVKHAGCPAVGYVVESRHPQGLKEEYRGLESSKIRELISSGIKIKMDPRSVLEVAYSGDTSREGLCGENPVGPLDTPQDRNALFLQQAFQAHLLICEMSFIHKTKTELQLAKTRGHLHLHEFETILTNNGWMDRLQSEPKAHVCFIHISGRYAAEEALEEICNVLNEKVVQHCSVAVSQWLSTEEIRPEWAHHVQDNGCIALKDYVAFKLSEGKHQS